jgi:hypothetical protein
MLIIYNNLLKKSNILNIIKINKIKNYSNLNKNKLLLLINRFKSILFIQKFIRKKLAVDNICPITLCEYRYPFISIKYNNKFRYYSLNEFIEYLNKNSSDFRDPITREILDDSSIRQIEYLIKYYKIKKSFNKSIWKKKINLRAEFLTITNCLNELLNELFNQRNFTLFYIYNIILPQFVYYFHFLLQRHKNSCFSVINNYINCINYHECDNKIYLIEYLKLLISTNNL